MHLVLWKVLFIVSFQGSKVNSNLHLAINLSKSFMLPKSEDKNNDDEEDQDEDNYDDDSDYSSEEED